MRRRDWTKTLNCAMVMFAVVAAGGCTLIRNEFRTLVSEPAKYGDNIDVVRTKIRNKKLAKESLICFQSHRPDSPHSSDFSDGFIEGFTDYLTFGGSGMPPVVPPRRYWKLNARTPGGHNAVQDWFAGFAAGAAEAQLSGLREQQVVLSSYLPADGGGDAVVPIHEDWSSLLDRPPEILPVPEIAPSTDGTMDLRHDASNGTTGPNRDPDQGNL